MKKLCLIALSCVLFLSSCENTTAQNGSKQSKKAFDKKVNQILKIEDQTLIFGS